MSQFRVEKQRAEAEVTLSSGESRRGCFFLSSSSAVHAGPERVKDVLNFEPGFIPFETADPARMVFVNHEQVVSVRLIGPREEPKRDSGYDVALARNVEMRSNQVPYDVDVDPNVPPVWGYSDTRGLPIIPTVGLELVPRD